MQYTVEIARNIIYRFRSGTIIIRAVDEYTLYSYEKYITMWKIHISYRDRNVQFKRGGESHELLSREYDEVLPNLRNAREETRSVTRAK